MSRNAKFICLLVGIMGLAGVLLALAPGSVFDLDGNSVAEHSLPDWNVLNTPSPGTYSNGGSVLNTWVASENPPKIFTTGGSKDPLNTTGWKWKPADTVPDKDTITNAYAAEYISGDEFFIFGGERFAVNGDSNIGVWFFQQNVGPQSDFSFGPGQHQNGDIFAVSAFTGGGSNPGVSVYKWNTACTKGVKNPTPEINGGNPVTGTSCADSNLSLAFVSTAGLSCNASDDACAVVNTPGSQGGDGSITLGWPYASKFGGAANQVPANGFFEAGIDVTALFPSSEPPCFSTFLLETRSSQEPSAVLKDFVQGGFNTCGEVKVVKDCACTGVTADFAQYVYQVHGSVISTNKFGSMYDVKVTDGALTCNIGTVGPGATVNWGAGTAFPCSPTSTFNSTAKPATNTATVTWRRSATGTVQGPNTTGLITCDASASACVISPGIKITKDCTATPVSGGINSPIQIQVNYSGTVSNMGNVPLTSVSICEDDDQVLNTQSFTCDKTIPIGTLAQSGASSGSSATFSGSYIATQVNTVSPGRIAFQDTVKVTADKPALATSAPSDSATATCVLCPPGSAACPVP